MALDDAIAAYLDSDPFRPVREIDARFPNRTVISLKLEQPPPATFSALIGDCVQNLRASLDHLAWQLVLAHGGTPKEGQHGTSFPIRMTRSTSRTGHHGITIAGGIAEEALRVIESVQPYNRPVEPSLHPLAVLNRLVQIDKHRTLLVAAAKTKDTQVFLSSVSRGSRVGGQFLTGPVTDGDPIAAFEFPTTPNFNDVELEVSGRSFVVISESGVSERPATELLEELVRYVDGQVVSRLESFAAGK